ncbi:ATP-binding cassette domain-containing protein [Clostridium botulinum]|uniref:sulfate/molybdate ABC transporter ATP-binding protein n=1 Tax=Clostridium botulinum TaxID=1491 RepID=UPI001967E5AC|nr:ATP-binding cassette domain-containing protein [Clostridium botulinum]MBN1075440.1 ATP-binding cassette domain-containing protein [Clostridium botulinum]
MSLYVNIKKELSSISLNVEFNHKKGILGFLGASGSGKSMSLKCIAGLDKPEQGKIILNDTILFDSEKNISVSCKNRKIGFLFQNYALFPNMTVEENIKVGLLNSKKANINNLVNKYINRFGLSGLEKNYPWQLSGGQQQRVALARALITSPDILLLDEPFSALDHHLRHNMEKELLSILENYDGTVIFVTHDIEEAYRVCDNIIVYDNGSALNLRDKNSLFINPQSLAEARLTGCKNISHIKIIDNNKIYAEDWGHEYIIKSNFDINNISYIGIREHNITLCNDKNSANTFPFMVENIIENPFDYTIYLKNPNKTTSNLINFRLTKDLINFHKGDLIYLTFSADDLFLF